MVLLLRSFTISCFDFRVLNSSSRSPWDFVSLVSLEEADTGAYGSAGEGRVEGTGGAMAAGGAGALVAGAGAETGTGAETETGAETGAKAGAGEAGYRED